MTVSRRWPAALRRLPHGRAGPHGVVPGVFWGVGGGSFCLVGGGVAYVHVSELRTYVRVCVFAGLYVIAFVCLCVGRQGEGGREAGR